jgi:hypothetical protein
VNTISRKKSPQLLYLSFFILILGCKPSIEDYTIGSVKFDRDIKRSVLTEQNQVIKIKLENASNLASLNLINHETVLSTKYNPPFEFNWNPSVFDVGENNLKVLAVYDNGIIASDTLNIAVTDYREQFLDSFMFHVIVSEYSHPHSYGGYFFDYKGYTTIYKEEHEENNVDYITYFMQQHTFPSRNHNKRITINFLNKEVCGSDIPMLYFCPEINQDGILDSNWGYTKGEITDTSISFKCYAAFCLSNRSNITVIGKRL